MFKESAGGDKGDGSGDRKPVSTLRVIRFPASSYVQRIYCPEGGSVGKSLRVDSVEIDVPNRVAVNTNNSKVFITASV